MKKRLYILLFLTVIYNACIERLDVEFEGNPNLLVVEGGITTENGPHFIQVTRTARYGDITDGGTIVRESDALVIVRDSDGEIVVLEDRGSGVYATPTDFRGEVGKSYTLLIETARGESFSSTPQTIPEVVPIKSLDVRYQEFDVDNEFQTLSGLEVYSIFDDPQGVKNNYFWETRGTYKIEANPELFVSPVTGQPAPKPCCPDCWTSEVSERSLKILDDNSVDGSEVENLVAFIVDDGVRYVDKYFLEVRQHSISTETFDFLTVLEQQQSINGDIFDPPPATVRGNMVNLTNPSQEVVGFFIASSVSLQEIFLEPELLENPKPKNIIREDCQEFRNGSIIEPDFWF